MQAPATCVEVLAHLDEVFFGELAVEIRVQGAFAIAAVDHLRPPFARSVEGTTPLDPLAWTLLPVVKPAACACSQSARCSRRRPRNNLLMTVPFATPSASATSA